jgi:hypothetical protein
VQDFNNPQSFNRYAYTLNNPLKYVDPSGYQPIIQPYTYNGVEGLLLYDPATHAVAFASDWDTFVQYLTNYYIYTGEPAAIIPFVGWVTAYTMDTVELSKMEVPSQWGWVGLIENFWVLAGHYIS